jgi:tRNA pseudouridine synthase 9
LQFLGNPIANDPCYGGVLFYGDDSRRKKAITLLKEMKQKGLTPISKAPHLQDEELDDIYFHNPVNNTSLSDDNSNYHKDQDIGLKEGETEIDYLKRTCKYCKESKSMELESLLHCDGIWLHALRYRGNGWDFRTPDPAWAQIFLNKVEL